MKKRRWGGEEGREGGGGVRDCVELLTGLVSFSNSLNIPLMSLKSEAKGA